MSRRPAPVFRIAEDPDEGPPELRALSFRPLPESDPPRDAAASAPAAPPAVALTVDAGSDEDPAALAFSTWAPPPAASAPAPAGPRQARTIAAVIAAAVIAFVFARQLGGDHDAGSAAPVLTAAPPPSGHTHRARRTARHRRRPAHRRGHTTRRHTHLPAAHAAGAVQVAVPLQPTRTAPAVAVQAHAATAGPAAASAGRISATHEFGFEARQ